MSKITDAVTKARTKIEAKKAKIFVDLCDIIELGKTDDGFSGHTVGEDEIATDIPCRFNEVPQGEGTIVAGGKTYQATHRIKFPPNEDTMAIKPTQILKIQANDNHGELRFEQPVRSEGSMAVFVTVSAKLSTGHRQPANV